MESGACVFCEIVAGRAESSVVAEDDAVLAIMDIRPVTRGHLLVIPRAHHVGLADLPPDTGRRVFEMARHIGSGLRESLGCAGVNLFLADGAAAGQEVFHAHVHVIPRYRRDGFRLLANFGTGERRGLDAVAKEVRAGL